MAASHTTKKHKQDSPMSRQEFNTLVQQALQHIAYWARKEVERMNRNGDIVITTGSSKNEFKVGRYKLKGRKANCWTVWDSEGKWVQDFWDRRSAVFYCILTQKNQLNKAANLQLSDYTLAKLAEDKVTFLHTQKTAAKAKNWLLWDIIDARLSDVNLKITHAQEQLEKNLTWAKYTKPQDGLNETHRTRN